MSSERLGSAVVPGLVVCLSLGVLLLGIELSSALSGGDELSPINSAVFAGAAVLLYVAVAWHGTAGRGARSLLAWWATMIGTHTALGLATGVAHAALEPIAVRPADAARWAAGGSLPLAVLQVGYSIGIIALVSGRETSAAHEAAAEKGPAPVIAPPNVALAAHPARAPETSRPLAGRLPRLEVYVQAVEQVRAGDPERLLRFAIQAARCRAGVLATRDGHLVAAAGNGGVEPDVIARIVPELLRHLDRLAPPVGGSAIMLQVAVGGYELLAASGRTLFGCLMGPEPGAREVAEVVLPALVARAEVLHAGRTG
jgi:hypothetical protein